MGAAAGVGMEESDAASNGAASSSDETKMASPAVLPSGPASWPSVCCCLLPRQLKPLPALQEGLSHREPLPQLPLMLTPGRCSWGCRAGSCGVRRGLRAASEVAPVVVGSAARA